MSASVLNSPEEIKKRLPHRYPLLLVDRVTSVGEDYIEGFKNVTHNEPQFQGHFPEHAIFPGVYILEAFAQLSGLWVFEQTELPEDKLCVFMSADKVKWRGMVTPGDRLEMRADVISSKSKYCKTKCTAFVDGKKVAEAELTIGIAPKG